MLNPKQLRNTWTASIAQSASITTDDRKRKHGHTYLEQGRRGVSMYIYSHITNTEIHNYAVTLTEKHVVAFTLDPSAAPPPLFRLAQTKSGRRADQNSAGGGRRLFRRRQNSARPRERRHITLLVSLSMEHVVSTASVVTV